jgi:hypothetical protein
VSTISLINQMVSTIIADKGTFGGSVSTFSAALFC